MGRELPNIPEKSWERPKQTEEHAHSYRDTGLRRPTRAAASDKSALKGTRKERRRGQGRATVRNGTLRDAHPEAIRTLCPARGQRWPGRAEFC